VKKRGLIIGIVVVVVVAVIGAGAWVFIGNRGKQAGAAEGATTDDPNATVAYTVAGIDQVFIEGSVKPKKSEEFFRDESLGTPGKLEVEDGETVSKGTVLFTYTNTALDSQISEAKQNVRQLQSERAKAAKARKLELKVLAAKANTPDETGSKPSKAAIRLEREQIRANYDLAGLDSSIAAAKKQLRDLQADRKTEVKAQFDGTVFIPQEKTRDTALLKLISDKSYIEASVGERDVERISVGQTASIKIVTTGNACTGTITYIADQPSDEGSAGTGGSSLASYLVKLSISDATVVRNGFHVQAAVNLSDEQITIPHDAVITDGGKTYVMTDEFGTLERKEIHLADTAIADDADYGAMVAVRDGLEADDTVLVSPASDLKSGQKTPALRQLGTAGDGDASAMTGEGE
jgi:HlyD family secretion protein